jgi:UDP-2,3-diacylglucosamine pyrophosphatase LpxH
VEWFHVGDKQITQIVGGHTHQPDLAERNGITYRNTGTWLNGRSDFLRLSIDMKWVLHKD